MKKVMTFLFITTVVCGICPLGFPSMAQATTISGSVNNPVWTEEDSPYVVSGTVEVSAGAKLTIKPGALIKFNKGAKLVVSGELSAVGDENNPIVLTSNESAPARGDWAGIEFKNGSKDAVFSSSGNYISGNIIKNAIIRYAGAIICDDANPYIAENSFVNNTIAVSLVGTSSSVGELVLDVTESQKNHEDLGTARIEGNEMTENGIAVSIARNNGRDYVQSPAGPAYIGENYTTAIVKDNKLVNNTRGIVITRGDNNILLGNTIKFSSSDGVNISGSEGNFLQGNMISVNDNGVVDSGKNSIIILNSIFNNSSFGIDQNVAAKMIRYNNLFGNKQANLNNDYGDMDVSDNYWGDENADNGIINSKGTASANPAMDAQVILTAATEPFIDSYPTTTNASHQVISGVKPIGMGVLIDGSEISAKTNGYEWEYDFELSIGNNAKSIQVANEAGVKGSPITVSIKREKIIVVDAPAVNDYEKTTTKGSIVLNGTKQAGTSIWVNKGMAVAADENTTWSYTLPLSKGTNTVSIYAQDDANSVVSQTVSITIVRTDVDAKAVALEESKLTKADSAFAKKMAGKLLLQVEKNGELWYVNPKDNKRYYIVIGNALNLFKGWATGITEKNMATITAKGDSKTASKLGKTLAGKFLLRVEASGKISYIDTDGFRYDIDGNNLMKSLIALGMGISNQNIRKVEVGGL